MTSRRGPSRRPRAGEGGSSRFSGSPGRALAAAILQEVESGRRLDVAWEASGASEAPDRAWIRSLTYGAVRLQGRIDHILTSVGRREPATLDPPVRTALRMGAYQLLEMGGVPGYAAVHQSVEQVKGTRSRAAAGLVNAVLRKLAAAVAKRSAEAPTAASGAGSGARWSPADWGAPGPDEDLEGYLATWGSHPRWLVRRWLRRFGDAGARRLVEANNLEPAVYLRPVAMDVSDAAGALAEAGLLHRSDQPRRASASRPGSCLRLRRGADPGAALQVVPGVIQDPAASLVVEYAAPLPGSLVVDLCAAPGGKALALSAQAGGVVAADLRPRRLERVAEGARRLDARVWPVAADARFPPLHGAATVLADVPCTGTGAFRRRPDGRWRVQEAEIARMAAVQRRILDGAASVVSPGGALIYATCTLEPEENWGQVKAFLERRPDFRIEPGPGPARFLDDRGCLVVLPHETGPGLGDDRNDSNYAGDDVRDAGGGPLAGRRVDGGFDGAFAARMRRSGG